jgi:hypothetical protein
LGKKLKQLIERFINVKEKILRRFTLDRKIRFYLKSRKGEYFRIKLIKLKELE